MSLKTVLEQLITKIEADFGKAILFLDAHVGAVETVENYLLSVLENPTADTAIAVVLGPAFTAQVPNLEALLKTAIQDTLIGSKIIADIDAQDTIDGKIKVLLTDIAATPGINKPIIRKICLALLALLNNKALDEDSYELYYLAKTRLKAA